MYKSKNLLIGASRVKLINFTYYFGILEKKTFYSEPSIRKIIFLFENIKTMLIHMKLKSLNLQIKVHWIENIFFVLHN